MCVRSDPCTLDLCEEVGDGIVCDNAPLCIQSDPCVVSLENEQEKENKHFILSSDISATTS